MEQTLSEQFLRLAYVEQHPFEAIATLLNVGRPQLSLWDRELQAQRARISTLKVLYNRKRLLGDFASFAAFYDWYQAQEQQCHYCGITPTQIAALHQAGLIYTKRWGTRGRSLELDRRVPDGLYNTANVVLCCYWCNNAKTDEFSASAFISIAEGIRQEWARRLAMIPVEQQV